MANETENWFEFGLWVKRKREAKGWTQEELAKLVGFSDRQTIYRIEAGASTKRSSVIKISKVLGESSEEAIAIAYGLPGGATPRSRADRAAEAAFMAEAVENLSMIPPERRAQTLAFLKILSAEHPESLKILGPKFKVITTDEIDQDQTHIKETPKSKTPKSKQ